MKIQSQLIHLSATILQYICTAEHRELALNNLTTAPLFAVVASDMVVRYQTQCHHAQRRAIRLLPD